MGTRGPSRPDDVDQGLWTNLNTRARRLVALAVDRGYGAFPSPSVPDMVRLSAAPDSRRLLNVYVEGNGAVEVYFVDDDRGEYEPVPQRVARALLDGRTL